MKGQKIYVVKTNHHNNHVIETPYELDDMKSAEKDKACYDAADNASAEIVVR